MDFREFEHSLNKLIHTEWSVSLVFYTDYVLSPYTKFNNRSLQSKCDSDLPISQRISAYNQQEIGPNPHQSRQIFPDHKS